MALGSASGPPGTTAPPPGTTTNAVGGGAAAKYAALGASVERVAAAHVALKEAAAAALPTLTNIQLAMKEGSAFAIALRDALYGSGSRVNEGNTPTQAQTDYAAQVANQLEALERRLQGVFGTNNQAAQLIDRAIQSIRGGGDPQQAQAVLRAILQAYIPGFQQEAQSTDPTIRELALELERYAESGLLY